MGTAPHRKRKGEIREGKQVVLLKTWCVCFLRNVLTFLFTCSQQHLKKSKQTEEDMLYGTTVRTPTKRRFLGTTTPNKSRKVVNSVCVVHKV